MKKSGWEICKCDFKLPNGDAVMQKERVHLREKKSQYERRVCILQGLGLTSLCLVKKLPISIRNLHLHTSPLLIIDISPIKFSFHSTLQKTTPTASLTVNVNASSAPFQKHHTHTFRGIEREKACVRVCVRVGGFTIDTSSPSGSAPALLLVHGYLKFQQPVALSNTEQCCNEDMREVVLIYSLAYCQSLRLGCVHAVEGLQTCRLC